MVWGEDVPEVSLNTVRLRVTCKHLQVSEKRFKVSRSHKSSSFNSYLKHDLFPFVLDCLSYNWSAKQNRSYFNSA